MEVIRLETFAESLIDQGHRDGQLRYQIHAHLAGTKLGDEIAVDIEDECLSNNVTGVAVL